MPSPFPGMDPYLERPDLWAGVHAKLIIVMSEHLLPQVRPRFYVDVQETIYVLDPDDPGQRVIRPDVFVVERTLGEAPAPTSGRITQPVIVEVADVVELRIPYLVVRDTAGRQVVATIEVLSPFNKEAGSRGRREFLDRRRRGVESTAHWIEVDLLRAGERPAEVRGGGDYYAALHRAGDGGRLAVWFTALPNRLPTIAVPLLAGLPDAALDLQTAVTTVYERFDYDLILDYTEPPPPPPLRPDVAAWAAEQIRRWRSAVGG